jgi:signal transduction histidine kinase/CheY-like chemotaxis protein
LGYGKSSVNRHPTPVDSENRQLFSLGSKSGFIPIAMGLALLLAIVSAAAFLAYKQVEDQRWVRHTADVQRRIAHVLSLLQDAETGQRGFLITGDQSYLEPFARSAPLIDMEIENLRTATADNEKQQRAAAMLRMSADQKLRELRETLELRRAGQTEAAYARVRDGVGKLAMDQARAVLQQMADEEDQLLEQRQSAALQSDRGLQIGIVAAILIVIALAGMTINGARRQLKFNDEARRTLEGVNLRLKDEITQRKRLGEQLVHVQKMDAISQLSAGLAHDFNNMLAVVMGSLSLLKRRLERGDNDIGQFVEGALDGAQRAATLTHRLLAFARQQPLVPQPIDVNKFVAGMSEILTRTLNDDIHFETVLASGIWRTHADSSQLENAILNLAVNARDAMPDGGKLTIETANAHFDDAYAADHVDVPAGQYVLVAVTDTGVGMSADTVAKAFDPFFTTKAGKGTGLGLSQIYGFIQQSGGHARIYSELGHGTTVKLYLPRYLGPMEEATVARKKDWPALQGRSDECLLIVEDDEKVRLFAVQASKELGYTVFQAENATVALRLLEEHSEISLLFTDIVMPDMNGRVLADEALRRRPKLKVLFTTGFTRNAIIHNGVVDGDVNFLAKPFTFDAFASKIRSVLEEGNEHRAAPRE